MSNDTGKPLQPAAAPEEVVRIEWCTTTTQYYAANIPVDQLIAALNAARPDETLQFTHADVTDVGMHTDGMDEFLAGLETDIHTTDVPDAERDISLVVGEEAEEQ